MGTARQGFNFYISYYDVYEMLESDKDKLAFIDALLQKQFTGKDPINLKGMVKFAYESQKHSINRQVKGFEDKTKTKLPLTPTLGKGSDLPLNNPPSQQVEGKGEEKGEEKGKGEVKEKLYNVDSDSVIDLYKLYPSSCVVSQRRLSKSKSNKNKIAQLLNKKQYTLQELKDIIIQYRNECDQTKTFMKDFSTFLNNIPDFTTISTEIKTAPAENSNELREINFLYRSEIYLDFNDREFLMYEREKYEFDNPGLKWRDNWNSPKAK